MRFSVYIRPLQITDANTSYRWRNNSLLWQHTGNRPNTYITPEIEMEWITAIQNKRDEARFAICLANDNQYIGNVSLTNITSNEAEVHIFIGEITKWGETRSCEALWLIVDYAFQQLSLDCVYGIIKSKNSASTSLAKRFGALITEKFYNGEKEDYFTKWIFTKKMYLTHPFTLDRQI